MTPIETQMKANGFYLEKKISGGWMCMHRDFFGNESLAYDDPASEDMNGDEETALYASYAQLLEGKPTYQVLYCTRPESNVADSLDRGDLEGLLLSEAKAYVEFMTSGAVECDEADNTDHNDRWHLEVYSMDSDPSEDDPEIYTTEYYI